LADEEIIAFAMQGLTDFVSAVRSGAA